MGINAEGFSVTQGQATGQCFQTKNLQEKNEVEEIFGILLAKLGEEETIGFLTNLDRAGVRLADVLAYIKRKDRFEKLSPMLGMSFQSFGEPDKDALHAPTLEDFKDEGKEKNKPTVNEEEDEDNPDGVLEIPTLQDFKTVYGDKKPKNENDDGDVLESPKLEDLKK